MIPITLHQIAIATQGQLLNGSADLCIQSISTDSRTAAPDSLFIAIKGETHDGHDHLSTTNAAAAMVDHLTPTNLAPDTGHTAPVVSSPRPLILVEDTRKAMGRLANHMRRQLHSTVIAVAGSNGKTGTKNLVHSALRTTLTGTLSEKSFNNDIGVPRTIFDADPNHDYLVLEIGTNHPGEILNLTKIAQPDIAILTNIGAEHLEFLGDLDGVCQENAQIIAGLNPNGLLILNGDYPPLLDAVANFPGKKITFGENRTNDLQAKQIRCTEQGVSFTLNDAEFSLPLLGRHTAINALAAIAVARHMGLSDADICTGLATATGPEMRLQLQSAGSIRILNDAYNANPHSMKAGLQTLKELPTKGRRVAILGDMKELGPTADHHHRDIGEFAANCDLDQLICIGPKAELIAHAAHQAGLPSEFIEHYIDARECAADVATFAFAHDLILLKGSRSMKLETVCTAISAYAATTGLGRAVDRQMRKVLVEQPASAEIIQP